ncbi:MAG: DoxX family protein [Phycisphaeraceae bacterium]|nr:DoxX family protein [Phycisphaeraceae bacterium]
MHASQSAAVHIVPLLARVVLAAAFIPVGYSKLFTETKVTPQEMAQLEAMGWRWRPAPVGEGAVKEPDTGAANGAAPVIDRPPSEPAPTPAPSAPRPAEAPAAPAAPPPAAPAAPAPAPASPAPAAPSSAAPAPSAALFITPDRGLDHGAEPVRVSMRAPLREETAPPKSDPLSVRSCERIALMAHNAGLPAPRISGYLVGIGELLGGAALLIGIFSRLAALGIVFIMAGAIYLTSLAAILAHPFIFGMPLDAYKTFFLQVGLLTLSLGIVLTGPGGLSVDHLVFSRSSGASKRPAPRGSGGAGA